MYIIQHGQRSEIEFFVFSGGEVSVKVPPMSPNTYCVIFALLKTSEDVMKLLLVKDALDQQMNTGSISLNMPYIPYARQDRVCNFGESFSLKVFCKLINSCNFETVWVQDPHSDVAPALLNNVHVTSQTSLAYAQLKNKIKSADRGNVIICAPDGGALKKAFSLGQRLGCEVISAEKVRNLSDGKILSTKVHCDDLTGKTVWMVDDIADGAMTFIKLAEALLDKGAKEVNLWVTHGIFSKGKDVIYQAGITEIGYEHDWSA
jgi:ribose-phosphate pyrophosphokinase